MMDGQNVNWYGVIFNSTVIVSAASHCFCGDLHNYRRYQKISCRTHARCSVPSQISSHSLPPQYLTHIQICENGSNFPYKSFFFALNSRRIDGRTPNFWTIQGTAFAYLNYTNIATNQEFNQISMPRLNCWMQTWYTTISMSSSAKNLKVFWCWITYVATSLAFSKNVLKVASPTNTYSTHSAYEWTRLLADVIRLVSRLTSSPAVSFYHLIIDYTNFVCLKDRILRYDFFHNIAFSSFFFARRF